MIDYVKIERELIRILLKIEYGYPSTDDYDYERGKLEAYQDMMNQPPSYPRDVELHKNLLLMIKYLLNRINHDRQTTEEILIKMLERYSK